MGSTDRTVVWLVARSIRTGTAAVAIAVGAVFYLGIAGTTADDLVDVSQIQVIAENPAVRALYGPALGVPRPGAFIVWRYGQLVTMFTGIWALLVTTRVLRGEEEEGRWDLLLATRLDRRRLTLLAVATLAGAVGLVAAAVFVAFLAAGEPGRGSLLFAAGFGLVLLTFVGVGAVASQVFGQRRRASGLSGAVLGGLFLVRMVADGVTGLGGLRWATPFGWLEQIAPFAADRVTPVLLLGVTFPALVTMAVVLAGRRDVGDGLVLDSGRADTRPRLLRTPLGFGWRVRLGGLVGWAAGMGALGLAVGGITGAFADFLATHVGFQQVAADYGFEALVSAEGFVGTMAAFTGVVLAFYAIVSVRATWEDEHAGRLDLVYGAPLSRSRWLVGSLLASLGSVLAVAVVAVVATYAGSAVGGAGVSLGATAAGLLNTLPVVALFFGLAVLLHGVRPEQATAVSGGAAAAAYVVSFIGPALDWPREVMALSPFDHLAVVPADPVAWPAAVVMVGAALALTLGGAVGYARRDLR